MDIVTRKFDPEEWNDIVSRFNDLSLMQTWEYADAKAGNNSWQVERAVVSDDGRTVGALQAMVRRVPWSRHGLVWISRGPLWRGENNPAAAVGLNLLTEVRRYWVDERSMYLRILPTFFAGELPPEAFTGMGYVMAERSVSWSSTLVDLSKSQEVLRRGLHQKWRNCLSKAERQNITVESGVTGALFQEVLDEYQAILKSKAFASVVTPGLLMALQNRLPEERRLWSIVARRGEERLGAVLIARYGKTCEYFVGAVNESGKAINVGQLLLWQAICQMKDLGFHWFDLGGTDPATTSKGILHFKNGVGGEAYVLNGEIEAFNSGLMTRAIRWRVARERQQA